MAEEYDIGQYDTAPQDPAYAGGEMKRKKSGVPLWRRIAAGGAGAAAGASGMGNLAAPLGAAIQGRPAKPRKRAEYF